MSSDPTPHQQEQEDTAVSAGDPRWPQGLTYRMLDYWTRVGFLIADKNTPGSGYDRRWPIGEIDVAARILVWRAAGVKVRVAVQYAREGLDVPPEMNGGLQL